MTFRVLVASSLYDLGRRMDDLFKESPAAVLLVKPHHEHGWWVTMIQMETTK